jgi:hypothetical protein
MRCAMRSNSRCSASTEAATTDIATRQALDAKGGRLDGESHGRAMNRGG